VWWLAVWNQWRIWAGSLPTNIARLR